MENRLYVGNLPYTVTDESLKEAFSVAGNVVSAKIVIERMTGRSKGFGFVEFSTAEEAQKAIEQFHDKDLDGRVLTVNVAKPLEDRPRRDFNRGGFGGGNRGGFRRDYRNDRNSQDNQY